MVHSHVHVRELNTPSTSLFLSTDPTVTCSLRRASIAVPAGLHGPISDSLKQKMSRGDAIAETRFISFVIAIGILMLFFGPHIVWKFMGQKRATELVKRWESEDARLHAPGSFVPVWTVKLAGYLSYDTVRLADTLICLVPLEFTLLLSVSQLQPHTHPLRHTFIQLRINLRYVVLILLAITCANGSSGLMAPPTLVPLTASRRPTKASRTRLCTAMSHCTEMGPDCRSRPMSVTGEPTQMRRLAEDWPALYTNELGAFRRSLGDY